MFTRQQKVLDKIGPIFLNADAIIHTVSNNLNDVIEREMDSNRSHTESSCTPTGTRTVWPCIGLVRHMQPQVLLGQAIFIFFGSP